jgi:hypothetical protein
MLISLTKCDADNNALAEQRFPAGPVLCQIPDKFCATIFIGIADPEYFTITTEAE